MPSLVEKALLGAEAGMQICAGGQKGPGLLSRECTHDSNPAGIRMSDEDLRARVAQLEQENAALKQGAARGVSMKVSEKGGLSIYGLGRFPVTLYKEQWTKLLDMADEIRQFIAANQSKLKSKE
jgi:hypothetical protein